MSTPGCYVPAVASDIGALLDDLAAESDDLDAILAGATPETLASSTPAQGWSVADTIGHLWYFDREGRRALEDPDAFVAGLEVVMADPEGFMAGHLEESRRLGESLMSAWHEERRLIIAALALTNPTERVPWYGPPMSPMSFATARLMETWAHGQDVVDALGAVRVPTGRLRHVAHLGVRTRGFSYAVKGREAPDVPVFVALTAPDGGEWTWGDADAADRISGPALDFCLLVTQRRLLNDLSLAVSGAAAQEWMSLAQAFAGGPSVTDKSRAGIRSPG
jgi:uncharacterized protein (TIGR03084 family)